MVESREKPRTQRVVQGGKTIFSLFFISAYWNSAHNQPLFSSTQWMGTRVDKPSRILSLCNKLSGFNSWYLIQTKKKYLTKYFQ
jgi:hypothetical protein